MALYPEVTFTLLNGFLLIIPLIALRYGIPALVNKTSLGKLAYFPPTAGVEQTAMKVYFITNTFLIFSPGLARMHFRGGIALAGWMIYTLGVCLLALSLLHFSRKGAGLVQTGVFRYSRNPVYIAYFLILVGVAFVIGSWTHLLLTVIYQISVHWLILSEERWCQATFGKAFADYQTRVRRYI